MPYLLALVICIAAHADPVLELNRMSVVFGHPEGQKAATVDARHKAMLKWMRSDLDNYLTNFDNLFEAKLKRIEADHWRRREELNQRLVPLEEKRRLSPNDAFVIGEMERIKKVHKVFARTESYLNAEDFNRKFVGQSGKLLKKFPEDMRARMNRPGTKILYVDTWEVPFFDTGTQTVAEAKQGVQQALREFAKVDLDGNISFYTFSRLMALFARPEFDDVRRYKLQMFPTKTDLLRFGSERSDAFAFGQKFPYEAPIISNGEVGLDPLSYLFGQRLHYLGLISHSVIFPTDGRVFTGPADFLEHDFAHAFFNLSPNIPGTPEDWLEVHRLFQQMIAQELNPKRQLLMSLVYFHFTHESGFKVLKPNAEGQISLHEYDNELNVIKEYLHTNHYYDWILKAGGFTGDNYGQDLDLAFAKVSVFFKFHFVRLLNKNFCSRKLGS